MDVFHLRQELISDYRAYCRSFVRVRDKKIKEYVDQELESGALWPDPLIQLNPRFEEGKTVEQLTNEGVLHPLCADIFRFNKSESDLAGSPARLYRHQTEAIEAARSGDSYVLITGTGSGKSLAYIIPIVDYALKNKQKKGIKAVIIYPMNALANSQLGELRKFLEVGFDKPPVTFARYTGQENYQRRNEIKANPPDILLTNYVMMEYIMTRPDDLPLVRQMKGMQFLVLDELHTYRGRQGADVAMLARRVFDVTENAKLQMVGTSATLAGGETFIDQQTQVSAVTTKIFGVEVKPNRVIGETLTRFTPEYDLEDTATIRDLRGRLEPDRRPSTDRSVYFSDPLSSWLETTFGLESEPGSGRLRRAQPISIDKAAERLSELTSVNSSQCAKAIEKALLSRRNKSDSNEETPPTFFAFRLHQFLSRGDTVYASLEDPSDRHVSLSGQKYVPRDRTRIMLPLAFCRECGQEYYVVTRRVQEGNIFFEERDLHDQAQDTKGESRGFLYSNPDRPWLHNDMDFVFKNVPDTWVVETVKGRKLTKTGRKKSRRL